VALSRQNSSITVDNLVKRSNKAPRWLWKKLDIEGVVFLAGFRLYMWYVEDLPKTYNEGDRAFYDAITVSYTIIMIRGKWRGAKQLSA
jgi:hypothetical protein